ncbi:vasoactive intestinal polypeptide receptor 1-like [Podarcis lilfordi]|uniref:Growth hormone-releasing hormone receptor n=1 Tax=Podarcis lilfordi TaxID=74358 RepID=A0AA35L493_9SAUR|nr:vasoactive intestinal polypeptide receptor 1-like [Podarcis lilfordi]
MLLTFCSLFFPLVASIHPECRIFQQLMKDESRCLVENETLLPDFKGCSGVWDGLSCWPKATFGETVTLACPGFFEEITSIHGFLHRNCTPGLYWSEPFPPYPVACGFEESFTKGPEDQKSYYSTFWHIYTAGYATSLASLITALLIFTFFRKFHCTRNYIHMHLFVSFVLRAAAVFTKDTILFSDDSMDHCLMSTVACKSAVAFFQFSILANFFWLLVEGMYLQTLLIMTFVSDKQCWDDDEESSAVLWIIKGPILLTVIMNFAIFLNVIRILVQKLKSSKTGGRHTRHFVRLAKSTLLLIPLFGAHYIIFAFFPESIGMVARLYIELGLGSFQGFVVALLYCFLNGEVQAEFKKCLRKWHYRHYLSFARVHRSLSRDNSPVNYVTQLSMLDRISPKRGACQNGLSSV